VLVHYELPSSLQVRRRGHTPLVVDFQQWAQQMVLVLLSVGINNSNSNNSSNNSNGSNNNNNNNKGNMELPII
jgi:hypothetical protein